MKFTRRASANWKGTGMEGKGSITTQSKALDTTPYSFKTRFDDVVGTNPEELIGAAHSGCYTMQLSFLLTELGFPADNLDTDAKVTFEDGTITEIALNLKATIPGISEEAFQETATKAKEICPVSKLLNAKISLTAALV
jgi:osmotically inducible protein OsmC